MDYIPFAFTCVLLDDGFARFNLTKARRPSVQVIIGCVWHEATNVDVGDPLGVLQALCQAELFLVGPEGGNSSWDGWVSHDKLIKVDHLVAFVVLGLHWLNWAGNVCLVVGRSLIWVSRVEVRRDGTIGRAEGSILVVLGPDGTLSRVELDHAWLISETGIVLCHCSLCHRVQVSAIHAVLLIRSLFICVLSWWEES